MTTGCEYGNTAGLHCDGGMGLGSNAWKMVTFTDFYSMEFYRLLQKPRMWLKKKSHDVNDAVNVPAGVC